MIIKPETKIAMVDGMLHFISETTGQVMICSPSLDNHFVEARVFDTNRAMPCLEPYVVLLKHILKNGS